MEHGFPDPTYNREDIQFNPVWREAFRLSELDNDTAPIGWSRYIPQAKINLGLDLSVPHKYRDRKRQMRANEHYGGEG